MGLLRHSHSIAELRSDRHHCLAVTMAAIKGPRSVDFGHSFNGLHSVYLNSFNFDLATGYHSCQKINLQEIQCPHQQPYFLPLRPY